LLADSQRDSQVELRRESQRDLRQDLREDLHGDFQGVFDGESRNRFGETSVSIREFILPRKPLWSAAARLPPFRS